MALPLITSNQRYLKSRGGSQTDRLPALAVDVNPIITAVNGLLDGHTEITVLETGDGTVSLPSWTFTSDLDTGVYRIGANNLGIAAAGANVLNVATTGLTVTGNLTTTLAIIAKHTPAAINA